MKGWIRRFAVSCVVAMLAGATAWLALIEIFLASFSPIPLLQLTLPVALAVLWVAGWQVIVTLNRWSSAPLAPQSNSS
jgi:hypothetical protein